MSEISQEFKLLHTTHHLADPSDSYQIFRSDDMIGSGGRIELSNWRTGARVEVEYAKLSAMSFRDVLLEGKPVVRVRRALDGTITGRWIDLNSAPAPVTPPEERGKPMGGAGAESRQVISGAVRLAGALLGRSSGSGLRTVGAFLSSISQEMSKSAVASRSSIQEQASPTGPRPRSIETPPLQPRTAGETFSAFFGLFAWAYQVELAPEQQTEIKELIRSIWTNSDTTERELVDYVVKLHEAVVQTPEAARDSLRTIVIETFRVEFAQPAATDRSRVLAALHRAIEAQRPGATGVAVATPADADGWKQLRPEDGAAAAVAPPAANALPLASGDAGGLDAELDPTAVEAIQQRERREAMLWAVRANIAKAMGDTATMMAKF